MKNLIQTIILVAGVILMSATTASVMTVKPATPKSVIVKPFRAMFAIEKDIADYVTQKTKEGWVVKEIAIIDDDKYSKGVVVLEKY